MAVGDQNAAELVLVLEDVGVIREYQVYARLVVVREHQPRIDEDHILTVLEDSHILADAVETTQWDDLEGLLLFYHKVEQILSDFKYAAI